MLLYFARRDYLMMMFIVITREKGGFYVITARDRGSTSQTTFFPPKNSPPKKTKNLFVVFLSSEIRLLSPASHPALTEGFRKAHRRELIKDEDVVHGACVCGHTGTLMRRRCSTSCYRKHGLHGPCAQHKVTKSKFSRQRQ